MKTRIPIISLSLGAGVQSSTVAAKASKGEFGVIPDVAIFGDTTDEPDSVYDFLDWLEPQLSFPVVRVCAGSLSETALTMKVTADGRRFSKTDIPFFTLNEDGSQGKIRQRGCTRDFKIKPIVQELRRRIGREVMLDWRRAHRGALRELALSKREKRLCDREAWKEMQDDALVVQWIGISLDEAHRMKSSRDPWIRCEWPLVEARMTRHDCLRWFRANFDREPPRSACFQCPFHSDTEWLRLKVEEPKFFDKAVEFEHNLQKAKAQSDNFSTIPFLHRSLKPLDQVEFNPNIGQENLFGNECEGMCGV